MSVDQAHAPLQPEFRNGPRPEAGFEPVALPALAAAFRAVRAAPRRATVQGLPPLLRDVAAPD